MERTSPIVPGRDPTMSAHALVIAPNWIGEAVMAQPLLALLRQR
ncbi:MAG TPA: lipopolysaccharide heptosyltransferase II, partial [Zeimonas sp.]|nr:lipopolysaccharide heptosyltransferase II [Zeimonas sp.]